MRKSPLLLAVAASLLAASRAHAAGPAASVVVSSAQAALLAGRPDVRPDALVHTETLTLPGGRQVVKFHQAHHGLPVAFGGATVTLEPGGAATGARFGAWRTDLPAVTSPVKLPHDAAAVASEYARVGFAAADARLVIYPSNGVPRLAWAVYRGVVAAPLPVAPFVVVDAEDGAILAAFDAVARAKKASVYQFNPKKTPDLVEVTLDLPDGAKTLENELIVAKNCIDEKTLVPVSVGGFNLNVHSCVLKQKATADANGDFLEHKFISDTEPEDSFAEVQMFHHVSQVYKYLMDLGMPELKTRPIPTIVNLRIPQGFQTYDLAKLQDPNLPLQPFDNAFFSPPSPLFGTVFQVNGAAMFFFQGTQADFSYDGDVAFHEFGHAMIDRTIGLIGQWHADSQGATAAPGSMNEGLADFFSSALAGDPAVGEYASKGLATGGASAIRVIDNQDHCLKNLSGEVHADSTFFSGALWAVRASLDDAKKKSFDTALMAALIGASSGNVGFEDVTAMFVESLKQSSMPEAADALVAEFAKRGQGPVCKRIVEYTGKPVTGSVPQLGNSLVAAGKQSVAGLGSKAPYAPGLLQIHAPVSGAKLTVKFTVLQTSQANPFGGGGTAFAPAALVSFGAAPISFTYEGGLQSTGGEPVDATKTGTTGYSLTVDVPPDAKDVHVMVVNKGDNDGNYRNVTLTFEGELPTGVGGGGGAAGGGAAGAGGDVGAAGVAGSEPAGAAGAAPVPAAAAASDDGGGCGCQVPAAPRGLGWATLAAAGLAAIARRRRR